MPALDTSQRVLGGLYGSLVGDALGVPVEFQHRDARRLDPVLGMRAFGVHDQPAGTWSDDGALLLCSVESFVEKGFDMQDLGLRFYRWISSGLWTATGEVFDIGNTTSDALNRIRRGVPAEEAGGKDAYSNGNGSLMRILPVALASARLSDAEFVSRLQRASCVTHAHLRSQMACAFHGLITRGLLHGMTPIAALGSARAVFGSMFDARSEIAVFRDLLHADLAAFSEPEIRSGGYVMETLTASLWCLLTTENFADCVLKAVNLGSDTDTTGCVAGGLAGALYGVGAIPSEWIDALPRKVELAALFNAFINDCP
jgi:ADP-ribosyl-[dinitrogen reductase] hydrolase